MLNLCTIVQDNILSRHYVGRYVVCGMHDMCTYINMVMETEMVKKRLGW